MSVLLILVSILVILMLLNLYLLWKRGTNDPGDLEQTVRELSANTERIENALKAEFLANRGEGAQQARHLREELASMLILLRQSVEVKLDQFQAAITTHNKEDRKELRENLTIFKNELNQALKDFSYRQQEQFSGLKETQQLQHTANAEKLGVMNGTIERSLKALQDDNAAKLEKMRETVDEKLQKTLETRLSQSFEQVSKNLESVQKGLGEMQQLATGVGDLKRVLTNVKTRGVLGEYQLENLLEQLLTPDQYAKNVKTKNGSNANVEFAIKLPGREVAGGHIWLPVDAKFPKEDFELLTDAYEQGNTQEIEMHRKAFIKGIRKCAADIGDKYLDPPNTTDFGILFLPFESLYAEVLRVPGLFDSIQRECRITITGPTTLSALLSSLQMGFRTLAVSKRSGEVWDLLGAVKTELGTFGGILEKTHKKLQEASNVIEDAGRQSRKIERKLKNVQQLPAGNDLALLNNLPDTIGEDPQ